MTETHCVFGKPKFRNCDGEEEEYFYRDGPVILCQFHGQAWPKVGEDADKAKKRTKRAKELLTYRGRKDGKQAPFVGAISPSSYRET